MFHMVTWGEGAGRQRKGHYLWLVVGVVGRLRGVFVGSGESALARRHVFYRRHSFAPTADDDDDDDEDDEDETLRAQCEHFGFVLRFISV